MPSFTDLTGKFGAVVSKWFAGLKPDTVESKPQTLGGLAALFDAEAKAAERRRPENRNPNRIVIEKYPGFETKWRDS